MDRTSNGRFANTVYVFYELHPKHEEAREDSKKVELSLCKLEKVTVRTSIGDSVNPKRSCRDGKPATENQPIKNINNNKKIKSSSNHIFNWPPSISISERAAMSKFLSVLASEEAQMLINDFAHRLKQKSSPVLNNVGYFRELVNSYIPGEYCSPTQTIEIKKKESTARDEAHLNRLRKSSERARDKLFAEHQHEINQIAPKLKNLIGHHRH